MSASENFATEFGGELIDSPEGKLEWIPDE
jgi:hypothetical protein